MAEPRIVLAAAATARAVSLAGLSRMIGRNANYLGQWINTGSPRVLAERDRRVLADFLGLSEERLGGPPAGARPWRVPRLDVAASAGPGALNETAALLGAGAITPELARALRLRDGAASIIRVAGTSMEPGLRDGDELLVDETDRTPDARGGIYVIRVDGALLVKRVRRGRRGWAVTSDNPDAPAVTGDPAVIGRVVWQMRRPT